MRRAARLGDGWMPYLAVRRARTRRSVQTIRAAAEATGRDLYGFEWMIYLYCSIRKDGDRARNDVATFLGGAVRRQAGRDARPHRAGGHAGRGRGAVAGLHRRRARATSSCRPPTPEDSLEVVTLAAEEVLPRLTVPAPVG